MVIAVALSLSGGFAPFAPVPAFADETTASDNIFSGIVNDDGSIKLADKNADDAKTLGGIVTTYRTIASAIAGILTTGIATALLGGATIVIGFFWNILSNVG